MKHATWGQRFWAWLIDAIIIGAVVGLGLPSFWIAGSLLFFIYWTVLESYKGQSIGKIALSIKVVNARGGNISIIQSAIQSFGKSFLLPIDLVVGWLAFPKRNQTLFNKVSDTYVVKAK